MALVMTVATLPSITLSKVDGMPSGRKLSAVGLSGSMLEPNKGRDSRSADVIRCVAIASEEIPG